jgi:hypothetical protein
MQDERREGLTTADLSGAAPAERASGEDPTNAEGERPAGAEPSGDEHPELKGVPDRWHLYGWSADRHRESHVPRVSWGLTGERHDSDGVIERFFVASPHRPGYRLRGLFPHVRNGCAASGGGR